MQSDGRTSVRQPRRRRKEKVRNITSFQRRKKLSRDAIGQFMTLYRDDLDTAVAALKEMLRGVLEVIVRHRKGKLDIFLGRWADKNHGHIVVVSGRKPRAVCRRPYGCRYA